MILLNPKSTKEVQVDGKKFKIGIIPFGKRTEIQSAAHFNKDLKDRDQVLGLMQQSYEYVRWGVKGHTGLSFDDGAEVPFLTEKEKLGSIEYDVVSRETMEVYAANPKLLAELCGEVTKLIYLQGQEAKNS